MLDLHDLLLLAFVQDFALFGLVLLECLILGGLALLDLVGVRLLFRTLKLPLMLPFQLGAFFRERRFHFPAFDLALLAQFGIGKRQLRLANLARRPGALLFANFGTEVAFPGDERIAFERDVLFPLAGLDPAKADAFNRVTKLTAELSYAGNEAARRYLNGEIDASRAAAWLAKYSMTSADRAAQRIRFIDYYRSYVINYNLGQDLVRRYIEKRGGVASEPLTRWKEFELLSPRRCVRTSGPPCAARGCRSAGLTQPGVSGVNAR